MKVRRKYINWVYWLNKVGNDEMFRYFFGLIEKLRKGKSMSSRRAAYCTLKHFYSSTTVADLVVKLGIFK